jgi:hypothetical protein
MTEYEKQKKEEYTKIPVANTFTIQPKQKISYGSFSKSQTGQKLSHDTRSDLKARL